MGYYEPDTSVVIKLTNKNNETHYRVFGGYIGGYLNGSSYRVNSGITQIKYDENHYYFIGESGSVYKCRISCPFFDSYCSSVLDVLCTAVKEEGGVAEIIDMMAVEYTLRNEFKFEELTENEGRLWK